MSEKKTLFLSYRRDSSADFARYLYERLVALNIDVFFDVENINAGRFAALIEREIITRDYFLVILSPTTLQSNWVQREIETALRQQKPIIPVTTKDFDFSQPFPDAIKGLRDYSGIPYDYQAPDVAIGRIRKAMEINSRADKQKSSRSIRQRLAVIGRWVGKLSPVVKITVAILAILASLAAIAPYLGINPPQPSNHPTTIPTDTPVKAHLPTVPSTTIPVIAASPSATNLPAPTLPPSQPPGTSLQLTLKRNADLMAVCTNQTVDLSPLQLAIGSANELYNFGTLFPVNNKNVQAGQCLCVQRGGSLSPLPTYCSPNSNTYTQQGADQYAWRNSPVHVSYNGTEIATCYFVGSSTIECPLPLK